MRQVIEVAKIGKASPASIVDDDVYAPQLFDSFLDELLAICNDTNILGAGLVGGHIWMDSRETQQLEGQ